MHEINVSSRSLTTPRGIGNNLAECEMRTTRGMLTPEKLKFSQISYVLRRANHSYMQTLNIMKHDGVKETNQEIVQVLNSRTGFPRFCFSFRISLAGNKNISVI